MEWQAFVIEVRKGRLLVRPLDGVRSLWVKVPRCDRNYIENELLRLGRLPKGRSIDDPGEAPVAVKVLGSSLDPTYIDERPPALEPGGDEEEVQSFADDLSRDAFFVFEEIMELFRAGLMREADRGLREFVAHFPLHIDSYHHLGTIAWDAGNMALALKYYEMAWKIGRLTVPEEFTGRLPWLMIENRPFLRACHGRALALMALGRTIEACEQLAELLRLNPDDNQGVRFLLPGLLARNGAWDRAREVLDRIGPDGTNIYTRCLADIEEGRRRDALRWLCAAVSYNPYVPGILLGEEPAGATDDLPPQYAVVGGVSEALEYARHDGELWSGRKGEAFLRDILRIRPFADRLSELLDLDRSLKEHRGTKGLGEEERARLVASRFELFGEDATKAIVKECAEHL